MTISLHPGEGLSVPLDWIDFDDAPIFFANHFLVQHQPDEFVLTVGQVTGPPLVGTPEQVRAAAREFTHVPIHTLARVGMTRQRLTELIALLEATLSAHDRASAEA
jgi:hypothetical protein